jgi:hypothetical protein
MAGDEAARAEKREAEKRAFLSCILNYPRLSSSYLLEKSVSILKKCVNLHKRTSI